MIVFDNSIYSSGVATPGHIGSDGDMGASSGCIFFVPIDLTTSNNIDFALNRIKNNLLFDDNISKLPDNYRYSNKDFFLSNSQIVYKLNDSMSGFEEVGKVYHIKDSFKVNVTGPNSFEFLDADFENYHYLLYIVNGSNYELVKKIESEGAISVQGFDLYDVMIQFISKKTGIAEYYKIIDDDGDGNQ